MTELEFASGSITYRLYVLGPVAFLKKSDNKRPSSELTHMIGQDGGEPRTSPQDPALPALCE